MKVKIKRIEKNLKQYELAKMIGISRQSLCKIECGYTELPNKWVMLKIADILECSVEELFFTKQ